MPLDPISYTKARKAMLRADEAYDLAFGKADPYIDLLRHHLPNIFICERDMKRVYSKKPPTVSIPTGAEFRYHTYFLQFVNIPAGQTAYLYWDLPEKAKELYIQCAIESVAPLVKAELRLIEVATGNYYVLRKYTQPTTADLVFARYIAGVETAIKTLAEDLFAGSPYEFGVLALARADKGLEGYFHVYIGRGDYRYAPTVPELMPYVRLWGPTGESTISYIDRIAFYAINTDTVARHAFIGAHFDTERPFAITYDTKLY